MLAFIDEHFLLLYSAAMRIFSKKHPYINSVLTFVFHLNIMSIYCNNDFIKYG